MVLPRLSLSGKLSKVREMAVEHLQEDQSRQGYPKHKGLGAGAAKRPVWLGASEREHQKYSRIDAGIWLSRAMELGS